MGSGPECWFLGYSRQHPRHIQPLSRHSISSFRQSLRMDASHRCLSGIIRRFYRPAMDLFASQVNNRLPQNVSRYPDLGAMAMDAFLCGWNQWRSWSFPPVVLMPRILNKLKADKAKALVLAPCWKGQPWFPTLLEKLMDYPRRLPQPPGLISLPFDPEREHPLPHSIHLTMWPLSWRPFASDYRHTAFIMQQKAPRDAMQGRGGLGWLVCRTHYCTSE